MWSSLSHAMYAEMSLSGRALKGHQNASSLMVPSSLRPLSGTRNCCPRLAPAVRIGGGRGYRQRLHASADEYAQQLSEIFSSGGGSRLETLSEHIESQSQFFSANRTLMCQEPPPEVTERIVQAVRLIPDLDSESRVLDICSGSVYVANALKERGVLDILAVDARKGAIEVMSHSTATQPGSCGNELSLRTWEGDVTALPDFLGTADAVIFCGSLGQMHNTRAALLRSMLLLKPGGHVLICEPLGRTWQSTVAGTDPQHMPGMIPDRAELEATVRDLSLKVCSVADDAQQYAALLQVPPLRSFEGAPLYLEGDVTTGFGRGSKQMGVPTANLPPEPLAGVIENLPSGVYFGWAQLQTGEAGADGEVHKMVMNIGCRPTCDDGGGLTVEIHVMHSYKDDFYGKPMRAVALGYIRPEMRFNGLDALVARIKADIGQAKALLDAPEMADFSTDKFFRS